VLAAPLNSEHSSTLASPNRAVRSPSLPPAHAPPDVVIVPPNELSAGRDRETIPRIDGLGKARGVAAGVVVVLVLVALSVGFALGYLFATHR
jgi:hypothetical protein